MAMYKVIQDIEAEDKILGPLSLRQFIYAVIVIISGFLAFQLAMISPFLAIPMIPHTIFFTLLAAPFGHDQSSEVWLLAKIRFSLKPRKRVWDQAGAKELVTITVPKRVERHLTDGLNETEVRSRLQALANTIDSRGWAVKNVNVNLFAQPGYVLAQDSSDRLIEPSMLPSEVPNYDVKANEDMMDDSNNTAQQLDYMIQASTQAHYQQAVSSVQQPPQPPQTSTASGGDYWFLNGAGNMPSTTIVPSQAPPSFPAVVPTPTKDEAALLQRLRTEQSTPQPPSYSHMHTLQPLSAQTPPSYIAPNNAASSSSQTQTGSLTTDPAIMNLASNDDLNIATIARQANKHKPGADNEEVVIPLR
jgi:hypothetical protein